MPAPVAAFSGTPLTGVVPVSVVFTDASTNVPTSWAWDFGDGVTDTAQSPTHKYVQSGSYTVVLTATNASGSDDETKVAYVVVTGTTLSRVMDGLAALVTAGAFVDNVYAFPSPTVTVPCFVVGYPTDVVFDTTFQGTLGYQPHNRYDIPVWFLVAQGDSLSARDALSNVLTDANSVKSVLDGLHTFGTTRCTNAAIEQVPVADVVYVGIRFDTETET
jgi:PKD repeat protein